MSGAQRYGGFGFGQALSHIEAGERVAREGWNGKGLWVVLIHPGNAMHVSSAGKFDMQPCLGLKTSSGDMQPGWAPSQSDLLAKDWVLVR